MRALRHHLLLVCRGVADQGDEWKKWALCGRFLPAVRRLAATFIGGWFLASLVMNAPRMMWLVAGLWLAAVWRTGRDIVKEERADEAFVQWLRDLIGDRNGVLLAEVLAGFHAAGMHPDWDVTVVRSICDRLGIPVKDSIKVSGSVSVGVHVDDLTSVWDVQVTPPPPATGDPSPAGLTSDNYPTTTRLEKSPGEGMTIVYPSGGPPAPAPAAEDEEADRQRLQDPANRATAAREEAFEDHLTDALSILREEVKEPWSDAS